jgi:DNA-binding response OmpR family regulator
MARLMKILFVENHDVFAATVVGNFLADHDVTVVPSVGAAKAALEERTYDVALVDYDLDDDKGDEFVRGLRAAGSRILVVAVSSHAEGNDALMRAGADAGCRKMDFASISRVLEDLLANARGPA